MHSSNYSFTLNSSKKEIIKTYEDCPAKECLELIKNEITILEKLDTELTFMYKREEKEGNQYTLVLDLGDSFEVSALKEKIENFSEEEFIELFLVMAKQLKRLHDVNIIHGHLTPNSFWIDDKEKVFLTNFSKSQQLSKEVFNVHHSLFNEKDFEYMSPEQIGKIHTYVDLRSDLYSLGIVFYEFLSGKSAFKGESNLDTMYNNITKTPDALTGFSNELWEVIQKLLEKDLFNRYQSIESLIVDLEKLEAKEENFVVAEKNFSSKIQFSEKIYGRDKEFQELLDIYNKVENGSFETVFVKGYSGIGKTSLIKMLQKPIILSNANFLVGKFEIYSASTPYFAFRQLFESFVKNTILKGAKEISYWKERILESIEGNGQVLIDIVPSLEEIIGKQPPIEKLSADENKNRFERVVLSFFKTLSNDTHPLVILIDDLQWIDYGSNELLKLIIENGNTNHMMIVGAYRSNEVDNKHLLNAILNYSKITTIELKELSKEDLSSFIKDSFSFDDKKAFNLLEDVYKKTRANPFFFRQYLIRVYENSLMKFNKEEISWEYDITKIAEELATSNITEFMKTKIVQLESKDLKVIQLASCIGSVFQFSILESLLKDLDAQKSIEHLVKIGLILPLQNSQSYKFVHDQIQQGTYITIDKERIKNNHFQIGKALLDLFKGSIQENIFEIVGHFNSSLDLLENEEILDIVDLNLESGKKAKVSNAYEDSINYFNAGLALLEKNFDKERYFQISLERLESKFLIGEFEEGRRLAEELITFVEDSDKEVAIRKVLIVQFTRFGYLTKGVEEAVYTLKLLDLELNLETTMEDVGAEIGYVQSLIAQTPIEKIYNLENIQDKKILQTLDILMEMQPCAYNSGSLLFPISILKLLGLTIKHGNSKLSYYIYMMYALMNTKVLKDYKTAKEFTHYAKKIRERGSIPILEGRFDMMHSNFIMGWFEDIKNASVLREKAFRECINLGDYYWGIHAYIFGFYGDFLAYENINKLLEKTEQTSMISKDIAQESQHYLANLQANFLKVLKADLPLTSKLSHKEGYEEEALENFIKNNYMCGKYDRIIARLLLGYFFENYQEGLNISLDKNLGPDSLDEGIFHEAFYKLFNILSILALRLDALEKEEDKQRYNKFLEESCTLLQTWRENAPQNFDAPFYLIQGELASLQRNKTEAMENYEKSIKLAYNNSLTLYEAICNERYGKFWIREGNRDIAELYLKKALESYEIFGAFAKVSFIEEKYGIKRVHSSKIESIDFEAINEARDIISKEVDLKKLIKKISDIVLKLSAAENILIFLKGEREFNLIAENRDGNFSLFLEKTPSSDYPKTVINYTSISKETVLVNDTQRDTLFFNDNYFVNSTIKSFLALPLQINNEVKAVIYLDNSKEKNIFSNKEIQTLEQLSTQMMISIENSLLYNNLESLVAKRTEELDLANKQLAQINENLNEEVQKRVDELKLKNELLIQNSKIAAMGEMIAAISHQLKQPINVLGISIDTLPEVYEYGELNEEFIKDFSTRGMKQVHYMDKTINQFRDFLSPNKRKEVYKISKGVEEVLALLESQLMKKNIEVETDIEEIKIEGVVGELEQVLINLVNNSKDACVSLLEKDYNFIGKITISVKQENKKAVITISDNAGGIPEDKINEIFNPYFTTKGDKGTGIGLYMSRMIIEDSLHGTIAVENSEDGAMFTITLDLSE